MQMALLLIDLETKGGNNAGQDSTNYGSPTTVALSTLAQMGLIYR